MLLLAFFRDVFFCFFHDVFLLLRGGGGDAGEGLTRDGWESQARWVGGEGCSNVMDMD